MQMQTESGHFFVAYSVCCNLIEHSCCVINSTLLFLLTRYVLFIFLVVVLHSG
jgi:hypothetical protein